MTESTLKIRNFSPKRMLKGDDYLKKEHNSIHNALFLPIMVVASFCYYAAHTNIEKSILVYLALVFDIFYYILTRLIFNYRLQKHLQQTIPNYQFCGNLWFVNWNDKALQQAWQEKLFILVDKKEITKEKLKQIINVYKNKKTSRLAYLWLIFLISASILFCMLLVTMKSHHKLADVHKYRRRHLPMNMHHFTKTDVLQNQSFL